MSTRHESGWLKQTNKKNKRNARSKREIDRITGGRVSQGGGGRSSGMSVCSVATNRTGRVARANTAALVRKAKRNALLVNRRLGGGSTGRVLGGAPRTVGIIMLSEDAKIPHMLGADADSLSAGESVLTSLFPKEKFRVSFVLAARDTLSVLDVAKAADILLFVLALGHGGSGAVKGGVLDSYFKDAVDPIGRDHITLAKSQGLPAVIGVVQNLHEAPKKHHNALRKQVANFFVEEFGEATKTLVDVNPLENKNAMTDEVSTIPKFAGSREDLLPDQVQFLRALMEIALKTVTWRMERSLLLGITASSQPNQDDPSKSTLAVSGYLRGCPLDVNELVHIPGQGTFQLSKIEASPDPFPLRAHAEQEATRVIATADPSKVPSLVEEAAPDMMAGEQTWPTEEEMAEARNEEKLMRKRERAEKRKELAKLPEGTSDYQAAWLMGVSDSEGEDEDEDGGENNGANEQEGDDALMRDDDEDEDEGLSEDEGSEAGGMTLQEWKAKQKLERDDVEFPDEVDTPADIPASERFAKYRGLKSFRTSPWHPKESLPREYARIFQVDNPIGLQNQVLGASQALAKKAALNPDSIVTTVKDEDDQDRVLVNPGFWVTLYINDTPSDLLDKVKAEKLPLLVGSLHKHENQLSVINCSIMKAAAYDKPVRARDELILSCGLWRRPVRPVFSENAVNSDKHKSERFLHDGRWSVATAYGPMTFGANVPTMLIHPESRSLVASGSLHSIDPDRVVLKKAVLSGHPIRVKKYWGVIRYMFYRPEDVRWFKPVDLWTKYGMSGRIVEPIGTHGLFKCTFNKPIKNNDTVCMSLYKRVFPKPVNEFKDPLPST
mmetsp:Transcript_3944/g.6932  ORF Transcript_3944/g.6932 Transcript_3944/m.6932 type:complete len:836 (+) Transcript_3944:181-2688(+)|eukprot:CAMPEP_0184548486 /NCGR_PEP_ID=MMETSP0199_2-20130426/6232_1 /TAXON_ID=1112570 /ORGANISM="Thraustochytrium sp., Strain LLF1b" /LENGTH=835 /DNA_ID=CAMNT_0026943101 /DNA_START=158 /DNA_END=2665 /DNA_ORIENTATION=+